MGYERSGPDREAVYASGLMARTIIMQKSFMLVLKLYIKGMKGFATRAGHDIQ